MLYARNGSSRPSAPPTPLSYLYPRSAASYVLSSTTVLLTGLYLRTVLRYYLSARSLTSYPPLRYILNSILKIYTTGSESTQKTSRRQLFVPTTAITSSTLYLQAWSMPLQPFRLILTKRSQGQQTLLISFTSTISLSSATTKPLTSYIYTKSLTALGRLTSILTQTSAISILLKSTSQAILSPLVALRQNRSVSRLSYSSCSSVASTIFRSFLGLLVSTDASSITTLKCIPPLPTCLERIRTIYSSSRLAQKRRLNSSSSFFRKPLSSAISTLASLFESRLTPLKRLSAQYSPNSLTAPSTLLRSAPTN